MIIPDRFRTAVRSHFARLDHRHTLYRHLSAPRILCIEGPPGVGKTTQLAQCLRDAGSAFVRLDASRLGGEFEGQPARELKDAMDSLRADYQGGPRPALILDDADMSLGVHAGRSYTVNTQLATGWLMARADEVYEPGFGPGEPAILVTGNDLSTLHGPLLRSGRARPFRYEPSPEETAAVLAPILRTHTGDEGAGLLREFPKLTVADVLEALSTLRDRSLERPHRAGGVPTLPLRELRLALSGREAA